jgi:glycosyltransferase involved in cell wall biosynthesis
VNLLRTKTDRTDIRCVYNGFDPDDFMNTKQAPHEIFTIAYAGFLSEDRIPFPLLPALQKFKQSRIDYKLKLIGNVCSSFIRLLHQYNLTDKVELIPYLPHKQLLQVLVNSDLLLLVIDKVPDNKGFLTGKIFDYLGSRKPILGIGPAEGDAAHILSETGSGIMLEYQDEQQMYDTLSSYYQEWKKGINRFLFKNEPYSRIQQTGALVQWMDKLTAESKA